MCNVLWASGRKTIYILTFSFGTLDFYNLCLIHLGVLYLDQIQALQAWFP